MSARLDGNKGVKRGSTLIEFALMALLFLFLLLAFVEFGRFLLVYNSVANAARAGVRYAIVHGDGGGSRPPSCGSADVVPVVEGFARSAPLDVANLTTTVTCATGVIGSPVTVSVVYLYDPLMGFFPLRVNLGSFSEGRIAF